MVNKIVFLAAAATLTACGGAQMSSTLVTLPSAIGADHSKSWISPAATRQKSLAFITDYVKSDVYIFALPSMKRMGVLTGFDNPQGECSDAHGHVWIANGHAQQIVELSHTGKTLKLLSDPYGYPMGCAVDPATGNLAVTDYIEKYGVSGAVLLYSRASGTPTRSYCGAIRFYYFLGFGPGSSLWVDGEAPYGGTIVCAGSPSSLSQLNISGGTIYGPSSVQWDNVRSTWVIFDGYCNDMTNACSYPVSGSGVLGSPTYYSTYDQGRGVCHMGAPVIGGKNNDYVVGADYENCGNPLTSVDRWAYPAGGKPLDYRLFKRDRRGRKVPFGAAISTI